MMQSWGPKLLVTASVPGHQRPTGTKQ